MSSPWGAIFVGRTGACRASPIKTCICDAATSTKSTRSAGTSMRNILLGIAVLSVLCGAARAADADHDSRKLTLGEQRAFFPLVCAHAVAHSKTANCDRVRGYPDTSPIPDGPFSITLDAIATGAFTRAGADEAYVTYGASFEPHANNFGGGILFARARGGWRL